MIITLHYIHYNTLYYNTLHTCIIIDNLCICAYHRHRITLVVIWKHKKCGLFFEKFDPFIPNYLYGIEHISCFRWSETLFTPLRLKSYGKNKMRNEDKHFALIWVIENIHMTSKNVMLKFVCKRSTFDFEIALVSFWKLMKCHGCVKM